MPDRKGKFILYSDISKIATGSVLYQHQVGKPRLIAYASKRMPEAAKIILSQSWKCVDWLSISPHSHIC